MAHNSYDHTSVLKMIEWRWGLDPLTPRGAAARNMAEVMDFTDPPNLTAPRWQVPTVVGAPCGPGGFADYGDWHALAALASEHRWRVGVTADLAQSSSAGSVAPRACVDP